MTAGGLVLIAVLAVAFSQPGAQPVQVWGGMLRFDWAGFLFRLIFLAGAALTALFAMESEAAARARRVLTCCCWSAPWA